MDQQRRPLEPLARAAVQDLDVPPQPAAKRRKVVTAPITGHVKVMCLSPTLHSIPSHFTRGSSKGRTYACSRHTGQCAWCSDGYGIRWKVFVAGLTEKGEVVLVEITDTAVHWAPWLVEMKGHLRGICLELYRTQEKKNGPVKIRRGSWSFAANRLPPEFDVTKAVMRLWGYELDGPPPRASLYDHQKQAGFPSCGTVDAPKTEGNGCAVDDPDGRQN